MAQELGRGQDSEHEQTREQERGGRSPPATVAATATATATVTTTATASTTGTVPAARTVHVPCSEGLLYKPSISVHEHICLKYPCFGAYCKRGGIGWRRSWSRGQDSEQEQTQEQERGLLAACDCGRDCNCDRDCPYECDCACDRRRVRRTGGTCTLPVDGDGTKASIALHDHAW